ncbi:MAG: DNA methyltransferase [Isosphaerales bacterium]
MAKHKQASTLCPPLAVVIPEGYYSGDKPNPNLRAFMEAHLRERAYEPETDRYKLAAFTRPISTTKATAIYNMHTDCSKKPHDAIPESIRHYTQPGDLVLDPFCGSDGTLLNLCPHSRSTASSSPVVYELRRIARTSPSLNGDGVFGQIQSPDCAAIGHQLPTEAVDSSSRVGVQDDDLGGQRTHEAVAFLGQGRCDAPMASGEWRDNQHSLSVDSRLPSPGHAHAIE